MALDPIGAALALHRFGFGPRAGAIAAIASDPRSALLAELDKPNAGKIPDAGLMGRRGGGRQKFDLHAGGGGKAKAENQAQKGRKEAAKQEAAKLAADN